MNQTRRLKLRLVRLSDLDSIHLLHSIPEIDKFNSLGIPKSIDETKKIIEPLISDNKEVGSYNCTFVIERSSDNEFIGLIGLKSGNTKFRKAEVWYKLHPDFWSKGFGTESLKFILNFSFKKLSLHRIEACCGVENIASIRVLEKVGMTLEGRKRKVLPLKSGWSDIFVYAIIDSDDLPS